MKTTTKHLLIICCSLLFGCANKSDKIQEKKKPQEPFVLLQKTPWNKIRLFRREMIHGEFGGLDEEIVLYQVDSCNSNIVTFESECLMLHADYLKRDWRESSNVLLVDSLKIDSVKIQQSIENLVQESIDEIRNAAIALLDTQYIPSNACCSQYELTFGVGDENAQINLSVRIMESNWNSFEKLKKKITLANKK